MAFHGNVCVLQGIVWYCMALYGISCQWMNLICMAWYWMVLYCVAWYYMGLNTMDEKNVQKALQCNEMQ